MNLVFISNYLNHHQIKLCKEFMFLFENFHFISTENVEQGFQKQMSSDYVVYFRENEDLCLKLIEGADVCIFGSSPSELIDFRLKEDKLTFLYTERFFKKGMWRCLVPSIYKKVKNKVLKFKNKKFYVLCAGAYVSNELSFLNFDTGKCLKWGYFPETINYDNFDKMVESKDESSILWCGRFLKWKHPEKAILLAKKLKKDGFKFSLKLIGDGPLKSTLLNLISKYKLEHCVTVLDPLSPNEIRKEMERSSIYLMTSDKYEGWGAVVNEAMNSGCLVVGSYKAGSVPYLIKNKINGFITSNRITDIKDLVENVLENENFLNEIRKNAYYTILNKWNAKQAALSLFDFISYLNGYSKTYKQPQSGPCSVANKITFGKR